MAFIKKIHVTMNPQLKWFSVEYLIGKPAAIVDCEMYIVLVGSLPPEITGLAGRNMDMVVDVTVSKVSLWRDNISFQIVKFYHQGSDIQ